MSSGQHKNVLFAQEKENKTVLVCFELQELGLDSTSLFNIRSSRNILFPICSELYPIRTMTFLLTRTI